MKHENEEVRESAQYTKAKAKAGRVPRLRFQEFRDSGNWPYCPGNEMFESISNKDHNSDLPILAISQEHGAVPRDEIDYNVVVTDKSIESYKVVEVGDFIISLRSFQGGIEYSRYKGICSPAYIILRKKSASIENQFFRYYYKTDNYIEELNRNIEGIRDGKMVSYSQFSQIFLPFPSSEEQRKIATCLSSLDELIAAHNCKLAGLMDYKKGLMQQLFPAEGESVPRMRFAEFVNIPGWKTTSLGAGIKEIAPGVSANCYDDHDATNTDVGVLKTSCVTAGHFKNNENKRVKESEIDRVRTNVIKNTIIFCRKNTPLLIGESAYIDSDYPRLFLPDLLWRITCDENVMNTKFFSYYLQLDRFRSAVSSISTGSSESMKNISQENFVELSICVPTIVEQVKIASTLSSLDDLIAAEERKIVELKEHKRSLMQGLFPSPEEAD
jgi:type I restriction enzyme S subunit